MLEDSVRRLLWRWFVRYNPLYFFSALCVLLGIHLVATGLHAGRLGERLALAGVLQAYELLLVGGVAVLFPTEKGRRPAVILAILAMAFLFDPTFPLEALTAFANGSVLVSGVWLALAAIKLTALARAMRLEGAGGALGAALLGAAGLVAFPTLLATRAVDPSTTLLAATWYAAAVAAVVLRWRPPVACGVELDAWGRTVLTRVTRAALFGWGGLYLYHVHQCARLYDVTLTPAHAAPFALVLAFAVRKEAAAWVGAGLAVWVSLAWPETTSATAVVAAATLAWRGWLDGPPRLTTGAVLAAFFAGWTLAWHGGPLPRPGALLVAQTVVVLLVAAWLYRLPSAGVAGGAMALAGVGKLALAHGQLGVGALLLAAGFASLAAGVALTMREGRESPGGTTGPPRFAGPLFLAVLLASVVLSP
jgi:hypothetical protein